MAKVMIVDDDQTTTSLLETLLELDGFEVVSVSRGGDVISRAEEFHPDIVEEDYLIEDILQRAFSSGKLERQESVLDYNYADLSNKWKKPPKDAKKN